MPGLPDISTFPIWAQVLAWVLFAAGAVVAGVITRSGLLKGQQSPGQSSDTAQIAMVTLDSTVVREHTQAVLRVADELSHLRTLGVAFREDADRRQERDELRAAKQEGYEQGLRARERAVRRQTRATQGE